MCGSTDNFGLIKATDGFAEIGDRFPESPCRADHFKQELGRAIEAIAWITA
jgi:hypothetical protein